MYQVVLFSKQSQATMLWFHTHEKAESAFQNVQMVLAGKIETDNVTQKDDFGAEFTAPKGNISHAIFNDMSKQADLYRTLESAGYAQRKN